jgi:hypothetical protein
MRPFVALAALLICLPPSGSNRSATQQIAASRTVLAAVTDARDRRIVDLGSDDFVVREGGASREVLEVHVADYPIAIVVDDSVESAEDFGTIRGAAVRFVGRVGQRPVAIGTMAEPAAIVASFGDERTVVADRLQRLSPSSTGGAMILEGVAGAARAIRATGTPFSAIVVISAATVDASRAVPGDLLAAVLDSGAMVHVVARRTTEAAPAPDQPDTLHALADQTHGQFMTIYSAASYQPALDRLADRLGTEMMIEYIVPAGAPRTNDVKVGVRVPGARVRGLGVR